MTAGLWTPPSTDYRVTTPMGRVLTVENVTRVEFTAAHVAFWRDDVLIVAHASSVALKVEQIVPELPF